MRRQRLHPLGARNRGWLSRLTAIEKNLASVVSPNEMAPALDVSESTPAMGVQRDDIARRNRSAKHPNAVVFQQDRVMSRCGNDGIERIRPGPTFRRFGNSGHVHERAVKVRYETPAPKGALICDLSGTPEGVPRYMSCDRIRSFVARSSKLAALTQTVPWSCGTRAEQRRRAAACATPPTKLRFPTAPDIQFSASPG